MKITEISRFMLLDYILGLQDNGIEYISLFDFLTDIKSLEQI